MLCSTDSIDAKRIDGIPHDADLSETHADGAIPVPSLPQPSDPRLADLMMGGDIGAAIAAMVMESSKELRKSSRAAREAAYDSLAAAQRDELLHMHNAANGRFVTGLVQGGLQLGSAGFTLASASRLVASAAPAAGQVHEQALSTRLTAMSTGCTAGATIAGAIGNHLVAEREDAHAKQASHAAETAKRVAENHSDDAKDASESLKKCIDFLKDWMAATDAARAATIHRA